MPSPFAALPEDIREILAMFTDRPEDQREDQREGFEDLSALVNVLLAARTD